MQQDPKHYLTHTEKGQWILISSGMPLCAPTEKEKAEKVAKHYRITLPTYFWSSTEGKFTNH